MEGIVIADRTVRAIITADIAQYQAKMDEMAASTEAAAGESSAAMDESAASTSNAGNMFSLSGIKAAAMANPYAAAGLAVGAVAVGIGVFAVKMADAYDKASNSLAANAGISQGAAKKISDSFLNASNTTIYGATAITSAYAGVAAQLGSVEGHALTAAQAQGVMNAAQNLATATGGALSETTSSLATVMQAYGQKAGAAAADSNILFNAARLVGGGVETVTMTVQKLVAGLGAAAPPLGQVGGLIEDLATHGETGRKAISAVTSGFQTLITTTLGVQVAQRNMAADMAGMTGPAQALAQRLQAGTISSYNYTQAVEQLGGQQGALATAFGAAYSASNTAQAKITDLGITVDNAKGKFVGIGSVLTQLHAIYLAHGAAAAQAAATDALGAGAANKLIKTIEAGPAAYNKDVAAVTSSNSAHLAAQKQLQNLGDQFDECKTTIGNMAIKLGEVLMPILMKVAGYLSTGLGVAFKILGPIIQIAVDVWTTEFHILVGAVTVAVAIITPIISSIVTVIGGVTRAVSGIVGFFKGIGPGVGSALSTVAGAITAPFRSAFDAVARFWNSTLGSLSFTIPGWVPVLGGDKFSLPKMPVLDTGGVVTGSGLAYLHAAEVVINPQQQAAAAGGGGNTYVTINVNGNNPTEAVNALKMYMQQQGVLPLTVARARSIS